jgi:hypothetical protein
LRGGAEAPPFPALRNVTRIFFTEFFLQQFVTSWREKTVPRASGSWSYPTTYSILGSRRYDNHAIIDVLYSWGNGINYEGDREVVSFIFNLEDKHWLLDDIYMFGGKDTAATSLQQGLRPPN